LSGELAERLKEWYEKSLNKALNLVAVPYMGIGPVRELCESVLESNGRILYITGDEKDSQLLTDALFDGILPEGLEQNLTICGYQDALSASGEYDLAIYDDVNSFPFRRKVEIQNLIGYIFPRCKRLVAYSFEEILLNVESLEIPMGGTGEYVSEPRIIETRVNIDDEIPVSIYEYLLWFVYEKKNVLLFTGDRIKTRRLTRYLAKVDDSIMSYVTDVNMVGTLGMTELVKDTTRAHIFFTDDIDDFIKVPVNFEIIVHGADSPQYNYRELLFLCLRSGYCNNENGEVIFLCQAQTPDIERTKNMTRHFNKVLWEKGYTSES
jgi:hypothetical protein